VISELVRLFIEKYGKYERVKSESVS